MSYHQPCAMHFPFAPCFAQSRHICFHIRNIRKEKRLQVKDCFCSKTRVLPPLSTAQTPHTLVAILAASPSPAVPLESFGVEDVGCEEETQSSRFLYSGSETFPALFCPFLITPCSNRRGHKSALQTCATLQDQRAGSDPVPSS